MRRYLRHIILVLALPASFFCAAQDEGIAIDTVMQVTEPPPMEEVVVESSWRRLLPAEVRKLPADKLAEVKEDDAYWYANVEPEKKKAAAEQKPPPQDRGLTDKSWFQNLLWIIILCSFIGVVIWYLASSNIRLFSKDSKKIMDDDGEEELTDDIFAIPYEKEIQKAVEAQNYRLAVRLWYLKTLKEMADRNVIDYRYGKTNSDYVAALYGGRYYRDFFRLTRNFEYTWYGQFNLSAEAYGMMQADFVTFKNSLS